jgi:hypothetical protein
MSKSFKPFLGSNEPYNLIDLKFPLFSTFKKDGVRSIVRKNNVFTRSTTSQQLPIIKNKQIQELFDPIKEITKRIPNITFDFEIYAHGLPFNETVMFTNTEDIKSRTHFNKIKSKIAELKFPLNYYLSIPRNIEFYLFDSVIEGDEKMIYIRRIEKAKELLKEIPIITYVEPKVLFSVEEVQNEYTKSIDLGLEGLVLRSVDSPYKYGRSTFREGYFIKLKPIEEYEAVIVEINERMFNYNESTESFTGNSIKRNTKENKEGSGIAATATVLWNNNIFKINLNGTEIERIKIWENREKYIGKTLIFKGMPYGMKDIPRFPRLVKII